MSTFMKNKDNEITKFEFSLDRLEGDKAVLLTEDDEELIIPAKYLPKEAKEGEVLILTISTNEAETERKEKQAKEILNEILNISQG